MRDRFRPTTLDKPTMLHAALLLGVVAGQSATIAIVQGDHSTRVVLPLWLASLICAALLVSKAADWRAVRSFRIPRIDLAIVALLTAVASALRLPNLERLPSGIHGDEGEFATAGLEIAEGGGPPLFGVAFLDDPAAYPHLLSLFINALGPDMAAVRLPSALFGIATIPLLYALLRSMTGRIPATVAAFLLATSAVHIHFSRLAINVIEVPFFACLTLLLLVSAIRTRSNLCYLLGGMAAGMVVYFHFGGRLVPLILALTLLSQALVERHDLRKWITASALAGLGGILVLSPFLAHLISQPERLGSHVAGRGIWNYWDTLAVEYGTSSSNYIRIIWEQFVATIVAFTTAADPLRGAQFYRFMDAPLLTPIVATLALTGLVVLCRHPRSLISRGLVIWFVVPVVLASALTDTAGQAHRLIHPLVPAIAAAALLTDRLVRLLQRHAPVRLHPIIAGLSVLALLPAGAWDGSGYFEPWVTDRISPAHTAQARCFEALPPDSTAYVAGAPFVRANHGPSRYLGRHITRHDLEETIPPDLDTSSQPVVVLIHEREIHRLAQLHKRYPAATVVEIERPPGTRALTVAGIPNDTFDIHAILHDCQGNAASDAE